MIKKKDSFVVLHGDLNFQPLMSNPLLTFDHYRCICIEVEMTVKRDCIHLCL